jgi:hypothetical protein
LSLAQDGTIRYFCQFEDQAFKNEDNWGDSTCSQVIPVVAGALDDAVIYTGKTCVLDDTREVETISVQSSATLNIISGGLLKLNESPDDCGGESICAISDFDGTANLDTQIWVTLGQGQGDQQHTFTGDGALNGRSSDAKVLISGNSTPDPHLLYVSTTVSGAMEINNLDTSVCMLLLKGGTLHANINGTLKVLTDFMADESGSTRSLLKASTHSNAVLQIDLDCNEFAFPCPFFCFAYTDVTLLEGKFEIVDDVFKTTGKLTMEPGSKLKVVEGGGAMYFHIASCG